MPPIPLYIIIYESMRTVFVVYEKDAWHSRSRQNCVGVFTSRRSAVNAIVKNHRIELREFFEEEEIGNVSMRVLETEARSILRKELENASQTQGYETNYVIEAYNSNLWY